MTDFVENTFDGRPGRGANATYLRNHNERAILTLLRHEDLSGKELADALGVSAQTASVITRQLETSGLIVKGKPKKGRVGKPQIPWALKPEGSFGAGLRIGRRSAGFVLMDMAGGIRLQRKKSYPYPTPKIIDRFLKKCIADSEDALGHNVDRLVGIGIAAPFEIWSWVENFEKDAKDLEGWKSFSFEASVAEYSDLPVFVMNDASMACNGELLYGVGRGLSNFAYFYVGALVGGGIVLNGQVYQGPMGNAGAFASLPVGGSSEQLANHVTIAMLETHLAKSLGEDVNLSAKSETWTKDLDVIRNWLDETSAALSRAALAVKAVLDVPVIVIDGGFPELVKNDLIARLESDFANQNQRGLNPTQFIAGEMGETAGAFGAANLPLLNAHFLEGTRIV